MIISSPRLRLKNRVRVLSAAEADSARFSPIEPQRERSRDLGLSRSVSANYLEKLEARGRIELPHKGFADLSLTTWVPRLE